MEGWLITLIAIFWIIINFLFVKVYNLLTIEWDHSPTCLVGKTALVTGSNIGIGYYTALDFAKRGARVILGCRNQAKAEQAQAKIVKATGNPNIVVRIVDFSSLSSVRKFAKEINDTEERLDILVNNAGIGCNDHSYTVDGLSLSMQSNHYGPFLLTILLINLLKKSAPSRIVVVSSKAANLAKLNINDLNGPVPSIFSKTVDYSNTKLCNILFTVELAKKLKGSGITVNALHPGAVKSDFLKQPKTLSVKLFKIMMDLFYRATVAGAQTSIYVSVSKDIEQVTGSYFIECKKVPLPKAAQNADLAYKLWEKSVEDVKLNADEKRCLNIDY